MDAVKAAPGMLSSWIRLNKDIIPGVCLSRYADKIYGQPGAQSTSLHIKSLKDIVISPDLAIFASP